MTKYHALALAHPDMRPSKSRPTSTTTKGVWFGGALLQLSSLPQRLMTLLLPVAIGAALVAGCEEDHSLSPVGTPGKGVYIPRTWETTRTVTGHQKHVVEEKVACSSCHGITDKNMGTVTPDRCVACHEKEGRIEHNTPQAHERFGDAAKADCTGCHAFSATAIVEKGEEKTTPAPTECARCHLQKQGNIPEVRIHADSECTKCHKPHEDAKPKSAPCAECHKDLHAAHNALRPGSTETCAACHQHQHQPAAEARTTCVECHSKNNPIIPATALFPGGHTECIGCHRPHDFKKNAVSQCRSCHEGVVVMGGAKATAHNNCASCHNPHDVRGSAGANCQSCHQNQQSNHPQHGAAGSCVGCHDPHPAAAKARSSARSCSGCHQAAATEKSFHNTECKQCHKPHQFVLPAGDKTICRTCHTRQVSLTGAISGHQNCESCHSGLPHRPTALGVNCESCHGKQRAEVNKGHTKCMGCHEPHGGGRAANACASCHQAEQKSAPRGHQDCQGCHQPHTGKTTKASCDSCHSAQAKTHHGQVASGCTTCHRPHGPNGVAGPPSCTSCHNTGNLPGLHQNAKHQECTKCHSGHGEALANERSRCVTCHADRAKHYPDATRCSGCHMFGKSH